MAWVSHSREQDVDLPHREDTLEAAPHNMLDGQCLCFVHRKGVARDQRQLNQYRLALASSQSLLSGSDVHVVEIWRPCFMQRVCLHLISEQKYRATHNPGSISRLFNAESFMNLASSSGGRVLILEK